MMVGWHVWGNQNLSTETYRTTPEQFPPRRRRWSTSTPCAPRPTRRSRWCAPPPGSDVYLIARLWAFWPILELEKGKTYRLHLTAMDYNHGFSLQPANINIQMVPGFEHVVTVTPEPVGHLLGGVQRILRHQPSHDGRPHLRQVGDADHGPSHDLPHLPALGPAVRSQRREADDRQRRHGGGVPADRRHPRRRRGADALAGHPLAGGRHLLPGAHRARHRHADLLDHLLRDRGAVLLLVDAAALSHRHAQHRLGSPSR